MVRPTGGGGTGGKRVSQPSAQELMNAIAGRFGSTQLKGISKITGPQYKGLPAASSYGEFDEIISLINDKDTMEYYVKDKE